MRAEPPWGDLYLQFRDADFGARPFPGLIIVRDGYPPREYSELDAAFDFIRKLHDQRLKGTK